ncbi:hypothetical protein AAFL31_19005 [Klebsiella huaxiensis]|uniref:hypothetical protein n=1 Tax=Klebsiella huaxiensis TaxID=2153354 RepID=UPI003162AE0C
MNYHFISDDRMFLSGIKIVTQELAGTSLFLNPTEGIRYFSPKSGDLVVLAVNNSHLRSILMKIAYKKSCRLLILLDMPVMTTTQTYFPWLAPKRMGSEDFLLLIQKASKSPYYLGRKKYPQKIIDLFICLGNGHPIEAVVEHHNLSAKYIYQAKRNVLYKYGFMSCNALAVLFCRDILEAYNF